jgi:hypothetical protein
VAVHRKPSSAVDVSRRWDRGGLASRRRPRPQRRGLRRARSRTGARGGPSSSSHSAASPKRSHGLAADRKAQQHHRGNGDGLTERLGLSRCSSSDETSKPSDGILSGALPSRHLRRGAAAAHTVRIRNHREHGGLTKPARAEKGGAPPQDPSAGLTGGGAVHCGGP